VIEQRTNDARQMVVSSTTIIDQGCKDMHTDILLWLSASHFLLALVLEAESALRRLTLQFEPGWPQTWKT